MAAPYPWQADFWLNWERLRRRPAQGYLLLGEAGQGVEALARAMAQSLLCPQGGCSECDACRQVAAGTHGDLLELTLPKGKRDISVDAVREMNQWVVETPHAAGGHKVVWLHPVEALNAASANAMLKTLEEPPPCTTFILQGTHLSRVLPTIRSRCQLLHAPVAQEAVALEWLQARLPQHAPEQLRRALAMQFGAPLATLEWLENGGWQRYETWRAQMNDLARARRDLVQVAADWAGWEDVAEPVRLLAAWCAQKMRAEPSPRWHRLQRAINEALAALAGSANRQLALESVLIEFVYGENHAHHR